MLSFAAPAFLRPRLFSSVLREPGDEANYSAVFPVIVKCTLVLEIDDPLTRIENNCASGMNK